MQIDNTYMFVQMHSAIWVNIIGNDELKYWN